MSARALRAVGAPCLAAALAVSAIAVSAAPAHAVTATNSTVTAPTAPSASSVSGTDGSWNLVYRNDFTDLHDVTRFTSTAAVNDKLSPSDTSNSLLQKPTTASDVTTVADPAASDGSALGVFTQQNSFATSAGTQFGWTSGRMSINGQNQAPPVRIRARLRMTPSIGAKTAVMWWPAGGGWPWEVDFAETFGGQSLTDFWGSRQHVDQHWHSDLNHDGAATEQLNHNDTLDATKYHTYDLFIEPTHMWVEIDGVKTFETYDQRWIPKGPGFFSIGKALTGTRSRAHTNDGVYLDWLEIYKISSPSVAVDAQSGPVGTSPTVTGTIGTGGGDTTYHVDYGTTTAYGTSTPNVTIPGGSTSVPVSVQLSGLAPASTYHYRLVATNTGGTVSSSDAVLTTGGVPTATASVASMDAAAVTLSSVVSTGGLPTTEAVQYAPVGGTPQSTPAITVPAAATNSTVTVPLTGLVPGAAYSFATTVSNAAGTTTGPVSTFVAPAAPTLTGSATVVQGDTALTVGTSVASGNLPTAVHVDYGTTMAYGTSTPDVTVPAGTDPTALTLSVPGLASGQRYHYRVVASNVAGSVTGPDALTGTTGTPVAALGKVSKTVKPWSASLNVTGSVRPNSLPTTYVVRYGVAGKSVRNSTAAASVGSGLWASSVSRTLTGLKRHTCYRVTIQAQNAAGTVTTPATNICTG